jgi:nucleotide-binding universal stress UspA family protein
MRILVPIDGSENSLRALRHVVSRSSSEAIELHLLNVQPPVASGGVTRFISQAQLNDYHRDEGLAALKEARAIVDRAGMSCQHHIGVGEIAPTIVSYAKEKDCQQITMGTHGRGGLVHALLGSVATQVIHLTDVPVLLIK